MKRESELCKDGGAENSEQREQQVQRPWGRSEPSEESVHCGWSVGSEDELGETGGGGAGQISWHLLHHGKDLGFDSEREGATCRESAK